MEDDQLIYEYFKVFSRLEYALKRVGLVKENPTKIDIDWEAFRISISEKYTGNEVRHQVNYIIENPPQKQFFEKGKLLWKQAKPQHKDELTLLLVYIKRVRNNLFHGGKYQGDTLPMLDRDIVLISFSLTILQHLISLNLRVKKAYFSNDK